MADLDVGMAVGLIKALGSPDPAVIEGAVTDWLDDHPEATTTVQDGSITKAKLDANLQGTVDDVAGLKSEIGDLANLTTTAKSNLVAAINEAAQSGGGGSVDLYYVTPEQYGAVGDGVTDDSQAVQDACDAGYAVYFDSGKTYYLANTVTIDHDCYLFGGEGATIKTKTPTGGVVPDGIVVTGTLKKITTLTTDYSSTGTTDNSGNQFTLSDMTDIAVGDIVTIEASDQYYNYARQYYHLGATLLIGDIYGGHLYTTDAMPFDIESTANVSVKIYSAPTAIIENINFVSDLDSVGTYKYLVKFDYCKGSIIRNCNLSYTPNCLRIYECVNTLVDNISVSKSKYDNGISGDGYGIAIYSSSETIVQRVEAICAQACITLSGSYTNLNTYIRNCNLASECRMNAIGSHENCYNTVIEDCVLTNLNVVGTVEVNRCRFIRNNRLSNPNTGIAFVGSHNPKWATLKIHDCVFESDNATIYIGASGVQNPIQAFDNIIGYIEITDCDGGEFIFDGTTSEYILSNVIKQIIVTRWTNCYEFYRSHTTDIIEKISVRDCTFGKRYWMNDHTDAHGVVLTNVYDVDYASAFPLTHKVSVDKDTNGERYTLPENTTINLSSNNQSAKFIVCGNNLFPNNTDDIEVGTVSGSDGGTLVRNIATGNTRPTISIDANGNVVFAQANNTSGFDMFPSGLFYVKEPGIIRMSATLKSASAVKFRPYIAIVNCDTGKLVSRYNGSAVEATSAGAEISYSHTVNANCVVMCYYYCSTAIANAVTTFEDCVAYVESEYAPVSAASIQPYEARRRTGDGAILSMAGVNNIMSSEMDFHVSFGADYIENPIGLLPSASGVSF